MKKIFGTSVATVALVASLANNQVVHAEEVTKATDTKPVENKQTTATEVTPAELDQAKAEKDQAVADHQTAKDNLKTAQDAVNATENVVIGLEDALKDSQAATPEAIDQAKAEESQASDQVKADETALAEKEAEAKPLQETKDKAQADVTQAETANQQATDKVASVEKAQADLEKAQDPKALETAEADVAEATKAVETTKATLDQADTALDKAKVFDTELKGKIVDAKKVADDAKKAADQKEAEARKLKVTSDQAQKAYADAKKPLFDGMPTDLKLDEGFVKAWKAYQDYRHSEEAQELASKDFDQYYAKVKELEKKMKVEEKRVLNQGQTKVPVTEFFTTPFYHYNENMARLANQFKNEQENGQAKPYDLNKLPEDVLIEANLYAVEILNNFRRQVGLNPVNANTNVLDFAKAIGKERERRQFTKQAHDVEGITNVAKQFGLDAGDNYYENLDFMFDFGKMTKKQVLTLVANSMYRFIYEGNSTNQYGHAESLLAPKRENTAVVFSTVSTNSDFNEITRLHLIHVNKTSVPKDPARKDTYGENSVYEEKYGKHSKANITLPSKNIEALKTKANQALSAYMDANGQALTARTKANKDARTLKALEETPKQTPAAQTKRDQAKEAFEAAEVDKNNKVITLQAVKTAQADYQGKKTELEKALEAAKVDQTKTAESLAQKQAALKEANAKYQSVANDVESLKAKVAESKATLEKAGQKVQALELARQNLGDNQAKLDAAKADLATKQTKVKDAAKALNEAYEKAQTVDKRYQTLLARYQAEEAIRQEEARKAEEAKRQEEAKKAEKIKKDQNLTDSKIEKPNIEESKDQQIKNIEETQQEETNQITQKVKESKDAHTDSPSKSTVVSSSALPSTGEEESSLIFGTAALSILMGLGLVRLKSHKKED